MAGFLFDQAVARNQLVSFFSKEKATIMNFGSTVNQTFEAHVFASVIKWYKSMGWAINVVNPQKNGKQYFALKFNTRGAPKNYSYVICTKKGFSCQIRHGLRTYTFFHKSINSKPANIVCDIVILENIDIDHFTTDSALPNEKLIAFGEVKHMSAFAELIASFVGMVHELSPQSLKPIRKRSWKRNEKISCFLYVSGILYNTAKGIVETIEKRKYDIDIYSFENPIN